MWTARNATESSARFRWSSTVRNRGHARRLGAGHGQQPEAGDDAEQDQGHDPGTAGGEPQDLGAHEPARPDATRAPASGDDRVSAGSGQPPTRTTRRRSTTRRAGRPVDPSQSSAASPRTIAAVAAVLASTHVAATTDAVRHGDSTGAPVRGSMRWWRARSPRRQRRTVVLEVAIAPVRIATTSPRSVGRRLAVLGDEDPPAAVGRRARDGDVAAERDEDAAAAHRVRCARLGGEIGGERLARRTQVDLDAARDPDARGGPRRARPSASRARPRSGPRAALRPGRRLRKSSVVADQAASPARPSGRRRRS